MKNTIFLLILLLSNFVVVSQTNRDPRSKDQANVFWDGTYPLYSLDSDEPILPNENGDYFFWATTNEDPTPKQVLLKKGKSLFVYKFITYSECVQRCNSIRKSQGLNLIEEKSATINSKKELVYTSFLNTSSKEWQTEFNQIKAQSSEIELATKRIELYNTIIAKYDNESIKLNYYGKENAVKEYNLIREKTIFLISKKSIVKKILKSFDDVTKLLAAMYQIDIDKSVAYYVKDKNNLFGCAYVKYYGKWSCHQIYDNKKRNYLTKLIIKNQISPIDEQSKISVITSLTGLDEEYFNYVSKLNENKKMKENFVSNYTKVENIKYKYVGTFNSDGTKKWGILLDEDKDTLFVGKWENGFPSLENGKSFLYNNKDNTVILEENGVVFKSYIGGKLFVGSMRDNGANGYGIVLFNNGDRYVGNFFNGKYHGNGMLYKGGDRYVGNFQDGKKSGKGSITFQNGGGYVGEWKNDMYDGMGEYARSDGKISEGMFENGKLIKSLTQIETERKAEIARLEQEKIEEQTRIEQERIADQNREKQEEVNLAQMEKIANSELATCVFCNKKLTTPKKRRCSYNPCGKVFNGWGYYIETMFTIDKVEEEHQKYTHIPLSCSPWLNIHNYKGYNYDHKIICCSKYCAGMLLKCGPNCY